MPYIVTLAIGPGAGQARLPMEFESRDKAESWIGLWRQEYNCTRDPFTVIELSNPSRMYRDSLIDRIGRNAGVLAELTERRRLADRSEADLEKIDRAVSTYKFGMVYGSDAGVTAEPDKSKPAG